MKEKINANAFKIAFEQESTTITFARFDETIGNKLDDSDALDLCAVTIPSIMLKDLIKSFVGLGLIYQEKYGLNFGITEDTENGEIKV